MEEDKHIPESEQVELRNASEEIQAGEDQVIDSESVDQNPDQDSLSSESSGTPLEDLSDETLSDQQTLEDPPQQPGESVSKEIEKIAQFVDSIKKNVELRNERDKYKDEAIQRMSSQLAEHEKGLMEKIKEPLLKDFILFFDSIVRFRKKFSTIDNEDLQRETNLLLEELQELLYTNDIEEIEELTESEYNRDVHKVKGQVPTSDPDKHHTIQEIVRPGFIWNEKVVRKQDVIIRVHETDKINQSRR